ncbi:MAG TPA: hypothetical protein VNK04_15335 [Gemmataceae bacterium]|nr:hypothetical protein [Gemmataceae bacterium]
MILLYTLLLLVLGAAAFLIRGRVHRLEKKYYRVAAEADRVLNQANFRPGNGNRHDLCQAAKRYYQLGMLVQKRDRLEAKYDFWQNLSKRVGNLAAAVRTWKGKKLPYTFGVIDVAGAMYLIDELTLGQYVSVKQLVQFVAALLSRG